MDMGGVLCSCRGRCGEDNSSNGDSTGRTRLISDHSNVQQTQIPEGLQSDVSRSLPYSWSVPNATNEWNEHSALYKSLQETSPILSNEEERLDWENSLLRSMKDPSQIVSETKEIVIITDKFPKARHHFMILPNEDLRDIYSLSPKHIDLLRRMQAKGLQLASTKTGDFMMGFHAQPHLNRLHLHVISKDLEKVKNKHQWNIFTTPYFIPCRTVIKELVELGKVTRRTDEEVEGWRKGRPQCPICPYSNNITGMKLHIKGHFPPPIPSCNFGILSTPFFGSSVPAYPMRLPDFSRPPPGFALPPRANTPASLRRIRGPGNR